MAGILALFIQSLILPANQKLSVMPDFSRLLAVCKEVSSLSATNPVDCKGHSLFLLQ